MKVPTLTPRKIADEKLLDLYEPDEFDPFKSVYEAVERLDKLRNGRILSTAEKRACRKHIICIGMNSLASAIGYHVESGCPVRLYTKNRKKVPHRIVKQYGLQIPSWMAERKGQGIKYGRALIEFYTYTGIFGDNPGYRKRLVDSEEFMAKLPNL